MKRAFPLLFALAVSPALAGDDTIRAFRFSIPAEQAHEECILLEKGARRRWHFKADGKVEFGIHYRRDTEVFTPEKAEGAKSRAGTFKAPATGEFCWRWISRRPAKIEGRIQR